MHAISCAAGYDIRWLMRAILRLGLTGLFALAFLAAMRSTIWRIRSIPAITIVLTMDYSRHNASLRY